MRSSLQFKPKSKNIFINEKNKLEKNIMVIKDLNNMSVIDYWGVWASRSPQYFIMFLGRQVMQQIKRGIGPTKHVAECRWRGGHWRLSSTALEANLRAHSTTAIASSSPLDLRMLTSPLRHPRVRHMVITHLLPRPIRLQIGSGWASRGRNWRRIGAVVVS